MLCPSCSPFRPGEERGGVWPSYRTPGLCGHSSARVANTTRSITKLCTGHNYCFGTANPDTIYDGPGSDIINARAGGDVIRADNHNFEYDEVYGGRGAGRIHAVDDFDETGYYFDRINGGRGHDVCNVDDEDKVSNCEVVRRR